jgi:hypothetical protein
MSIESDDTRTPADDGSIAATGAGNAATAGAVEDDPATMLARRGVFTAGAVTADAGAAAATSPPLDFRDGVVAALVDAAVRFDAAGLVAAVVVDRSSAERSTQPIRVTRTQPFGAALVSMSTEVPASRDATLFAALFPRERTTTERLPTRVVEDDFWEVRRLRSTNPSTDTRA